MIQAEIDAAAELIDFFRFNAKYALELESNQPISVDVSTNSMVYRGLEVRGCPLLLRLPFFSPNSLFLPTPTRPFPLPPAGFRGGHLALQLHSDRWQPGRSSGIDGECRGGLGKPGMGRTGHRKAGKGDSLSPRLRLAWFGIPKEQIQPSWYSGAVQ